MYLPSLVMDTDLDFSNQIDRLIYPGYAGQTLSATGLPDNNMAVGSAFLWLPFFMLAHGVTLVAEAMGSSLAADGYSDWYQGLVYAGNSLYVAAGLGLLLCVLVRFTDRRSAMIAGLTTLLTTQLSYYIWSHSAMAHSGSFFAVCVFLYLYTTRGLGLATVLAAALMFLVRWQDVLYALPLLWDAVAGLRGPARTVGKRLAGYAALVGVFLLAISPQLVVWKILFGSFFSPPPRVQRLDLLAPHPFETLFNLSDGLLSWHPVLALGFAGLILFARRNRPLAARLLLALLVQFYFIASLQWHSGGSFGMRFFVGGLPLFALGLAVLSSEAWKRRWTAILLGSVLVLLTLFNQAFVFQFMHNLVPHANALTYEQYIPDKFHLPSIYAAEQHYLAAYDAIQRQDYLAGYHSARQACSLHSGQDKHCLAAALLALIVGDDVNSRTRFSALAAKRPEEPVYAQGLAVLMARSGDSADALGLLQGRGDETSVALVRAMQSGTTSLEPFFMSQAFALLNRLQY